MNLNFQSTLVTNGKEKRMTENNFNLTKEGYVLYPIDTVIELKRTENTLPIARVIITEIQWKCNQTIINYELKSIISVN